MRAESTSLCLLRSLVRTRLTRRFGTAAQACLSTACAALQSSAARAQPTASFARHELLRNAPLPRRRGGLVPGFGARLGGLPSPSLLSPVSAGAGSLPAGEKVRYAHLARCCARLSRRAQTARFNPEDTPRALLPRHSKGLFSAATPAQSVPVQGMRLLAARLTAAQRAVGVLPTPDAAGCAPPVCSHAASYALAANSALCAWPLPRRCNRAPLLRPPLS